jgi:hypothetical protein
MFDHAFSSVLSLTASRLDIPTSQLAALSGTRSSFRAECTLLRTIMCYIRYRPEQFMYEPPSPGPRPLPRLTWAVPVDVTELGVSLEAYTNQLSQQITFRLCHRFGAGALAQLPQEIVDHIIGDAHQLEKTALHSKWIKDFNCFQGRCTRGQHFVPYGVHTEDVWQNLFVDGNFSDDDEGPLHKGGYSEKEKAVMVEDFIDESEEFCDELVWELHDQAEEAWLDRVCLCNPAKVSEENIVNFSWLNNVRITSTLSRTELTMSTDLEDTVRHRGGHPSRSPFRQFQTLHEC